MRLWESRIIPYLPDSQLLAQKRECDLIWKDIVEGRKTKHILINYIWEYENPVKELSVYYWLLKEEFDKRGFKFNFSKNFITKNVFYGYDYKPFAEHHTDGYLRQCYYNLEEKFVRGQKDFTLDKWKQLYHFCKKELKWLD